MAVAPAVADVFVIEGARPLNGRIRAAGNKNGALPILAACLLTAEPVTLTNVPRIRDVETMIELLADLGAEVGWTGTNEVRVNAANVTKSAPDASLCSRIRASFLLAGPLLARFGKAKGKAPELVCGHQFVDAFGIMGRSRWPRIREWASVGRL